MLISKFDLYKTEWLDLVFDDRNKNYGAYELRQHNSRTMLTAMFIAFLTIGSAALILEVVIKPVAAAIPPAIHITQVDNFRIIHPPTVHPPSAAPHTQPALHVSANPVHAFVPTPDPVVPPHVIATTVPPGPLGPATIDNPGTGTGINDQPGTPGPAGPATVSNEPVNDFTMLERMPEPVGGKEAWAKFLTKNISYPAMATDAHAQGAVWVSFIVEADGKLSNIKVLRGPGYGMDEEAVRVLKMAPAWKPGIQNGHPVRVLFNLPIRFTINDDDN